MTTRASYCPDCKAVPILVSIAVQVILDVIGSGTDDKDSLKTKFLERCLPLIRQVQSHKHDVAELLGRIAELIQDGDLNDAETVSALDRESEALRDEVFNWEEHGSERIVFLGPTLH